jgi:hypothetical protein
MRTKSMRATVVWTVIAVYAFAIGVHVMPDSTLRRDLVHPADAIALPLFAQRWNLFAPAPPTANLATYMLVRYEQGGVLRTSRLIDLSSEVRNATTSRRWAPPRIVRVVTKYNVAFEQHMKDDVREAVRRHVEVNAPLPTWLAGEIARRRARDLAEYGRVLSAAAPAGAPAGAAIVSVRGLVISTPLTSFAQRDQKHGEPAVALADPNAPAPLLERPGPVVFDSGWLHYDAGVARMLP